ncbi:MAG TPA: chemotaxis-specific protein-glutamate methyltransferase CheB [Thermoanaerobaculia bacterium]|jgi:two-component system chemotaxis response regulator CheB|nr:chemotaxis-specific protein-glutamate methyltransferase CheB [Thermoanaerobaculia bacterium]
MSKRIRVLVVEDSLTVRKRLCEVLAAASELEVIAEAEDGKRGIELCQELRPDVVTLDMMLPMMSGLAATEYIMAHCPTPILIVSSSINRGELYRTYDALAAGAVDVLEKPRGDDTDGDWEGRLVAAVKLVSRIRVITHPRARLGVLGRTPAPAAAVPLRSPRPGAQVVALGASTGGPGAILEILHAIPSPFPLPILIVLHIGDPFATAFADWLDGQSSHEVAFARDREPLKGDRVVLAPPGCHLAVGGGRLLLKSGPERHSCRPSVDVLFESVAWEYGAAAAACLLTGMGRDGAAGLLEVRAAGGVTVVQDEATSVVYGMPREAVLLGAAEQVLPVGAIGPFIASLAAGAEEPS